MTDIFETLSHINDLYSKPMELAAVWVMKGILTGNGLKRRIAPGELLCIEDGLIVPCLKSPTHEVVKCRGTLVTQFEFTCKDLETNEIVNIKFTVDK